jgi:hypothetical protein
LANSDQVALCLSGMPARCCDRSGALILLHSGRSPGAPKPAKCAGGALGSSSLKEDKAMSVEQCAGLIIAGMQARRREVVMSAKGKLGRWLKLIAPGLVENMALAALKDDVKPQA